MSTSAKNTRKSSLTGYANGLKEIVNAHILVDHCEHGKLQKRAVCDDDKAKVGEKFRYFTKLQKKDSAEYYRLLGDARALIKDYETYLNENNDGTDKVNRELLDRFSAATSKTAKTGKRKKKVEIDDDPDYIPSDDDATTAAVNTATTKGNTKAPTIVSSPPPKNAKTTMSTNNGTAPTAAASSSAALVSAPDNEINANEINSLLKNTFVVQDNIFITKPYYKYEQESDASTYKRRFYALVVFALTKEDAKKIVASFPSGDRTVRIEQPNVTGLFVEYMQAFAEDLFRDSPEAQEAICETIMSGVLKTRKITDIKFPVDLLQSVTGRAIPVARYNENYNICQACEQNLKCMVVASVFEIGANTRIQIHQEQMDGLIQDRGVRGNDGNRVGSASPMPGYYGSK